MYKIVSGFSLCSVNYINEKVDKDSPSVVE